MGNSMSDDFVRMNRDERDRFQLYIILFDMELIKCKQKRVIKSGKIVYHYFPIK